MFFMHSLIYGYEHDERVKKLHPDAKKKSPRQNGGRGACGKWVKARGATCGCVFLSVKKKPLSKMAGAGANNKTTSVSRAAALRGKKK